MTVPVRGRKDEAAALDLRGIEACCVATAFIRLLRRAAALLIYGGIIDGVSSREELITMALSYCLRLAFRLSIGFHTS